MPCARRQLPGGPAQDGGPTAAVRHPARPVRTILAGALRVGLRRPRHGGPRLLAVATVSRAPTELYLGALRAQSRTSRVALVQVVRAVIMLGLTVVLTGVLGTVGAGVAVAVTQGLPSCSPPSACGGCSGQTGTEHSPKMDSADDGGQPRRIAAPVPPVDERQARLPADPAAAGVGVPDLATRRRPRGEAVGALALFLVSLRGVDLAGMNGLGLLSVLPPGAIAGVMLIALVFVLGLVLPRHPRRPRRRPRRPGRLPGRGHRLRRARPRFPTAYQIAGFVDYVSRTGHTAPGLAAYFSWPGFFALISFVTGAAGTHSLLTLLRVWPMVIDLLYLPPLFLIMRNLPSPGAPSGWRPSSSRRQLGRAGLLLAAVVQLPALPRVRGHPGQLVHRSGPADLRIRRPDSGGCRGPADGPVRSGPASCLPVRPPPDREASFSSS